jgi:hypothetical protein
MESMVIVANETACYDLHDEMLRGAACCVLRDPVFLETS